MPYTESKGDADVIDRPPKKKKETPKLPPMFKVIYHNDDFTPMEFVTWTLMEFFNKSEIDANSITFEVHKFGHAVAGVYDYQIAEQKIWEVIESAKDPLFSEALKLYDNKLDIGLDEDSKIFKRSLENNKTENH